MVARILIADDHDLVRGMLRKLFSEVGFDVTEAVDGADCIDSFQRQPVDIILCDILMPNHGAFDLRQCEAHGCGIRCEVIRWAAALTNLLYAGFR